MKSIAVAILALALAGCATAEPPEPGPITSTPLVLLENISYTPDSVTIEPGTAVTWEWNDGAIEHDVVFDDFKSEIQSTGTFEHSFAEPGTYEYICSLHPNMVGTVLVVEREQ